MVFSCSEFPQQKHYPCTLSFSHHIDVITGRALKVFGFIKRNTKLFKSANCLRSLYFSLVRSVLEYGAVVWHPYLAKDRLRLERVQHKFLSYAVFKLNLPSLQRDHSDSCRILSIPSLLSRRDDADSQFIYTLSSIIF